MTIYDLIATLFGVSGWLFSVYLWRRLVRLSIQKSEELSKPIEHKRIDTHIGAPPRASRPASELLPLRQAKHEPPSVQPKEQVPQGNMYAEAVIDKVRLVLFGHPKYVLACLVLLLGAIAVWRGVTFVMRDKKSTPESGRATTIIDVGEISFIKIVKIDNHLIEQPGCD